MAKPMHANFRCDARATPAIAIVRAREVYFLRAFHKRHQMLYLAVAAAFLTIGFFAGATAEALGWLK